MTPGAHKLLQEYASHINLELEQIFDIPLDEWLGVKPSNHAYEAFEHMREYTLRPSKRVRGSLTAFSYDQATGAKFGKSGLLAGAAMEVAQSYLLIVDDIMDRSALRRGKMSIHEIYRQKIADQHTADMAALSVGLVAGHLVNLIVSMAKENPSRLVKANEIIHRNLLITGLGQLEDLYHTSEVATEEQIIEKYKFKTSYYTFINPIQAGMAMGGVNDDKVFAEAINVGEAAGVAFQLHDDVLGIYGNSAETGKPASDDVEEGKQTLLLTYAREHASQADKTILHDIIGKSTVNELELGEVRRIMESSGARGFVENQATWYAQQAKQALDSSSFWDGRSKSALKDLIDYSVTREK